MVFGRFALRSLREWQARFEISEGCFLIKPAAIRLRQGYGGTREGIELSLWHMPKALRGDPLDNGRFACLSRCEWQARFLDQRGLFFF